MLSSESVASGIKDNLAEKIEQSTSPFRWQTGGMAYPRVTRLTVGDKTAATISVIEYLKPFTEDEIPLLICWATPLPPNCRKASSCSIRGMLYEEFIEPLKAG